MFLRRFVAPVTVGLAGGTALLAWLLAGGTPRAGLAFEARVRKPDEGVSGVR